MKRCNFGRRKAARKERAERQKEARALRSASDQLARLDTGGFKARKERGRLNRALRKRKGNR